MVSRRVLLLLAGLVFMGPCIASAQKDGGKSKTNVEEGTISEIRSYLKPFDYDGESLRNPFEAPIEAKPLVPGEVYGPFLKLQRFSLEKMKLKGLVWNSENPVAIFRAPDGTDYKLRIKDHIGENFGYIAAIREKEVVVIQTVEENGKRYSTTKVVFLQ